MAITLKPLTPDDSYHPDPNDPDLGGHHMDEQFPAGMFRFEKRSS